LFCSDGLGSSSCRLGGGGCQSPSMSRLVSVGPGEVPPQLVSPGGVASVVWWAWLPRPLLRSLSLLVRTAKHPLTPFARWWILSTWNCLAGGCTSTWTGSCTVLSLGVDVVHGDGIRDCLVGSLCGVDRVSTSQIWHLSGFIHGDFSRLVLRSTMMLGHSGGSYPAPCLHCRTGVCTILLRLCTSTECPKRV
jgi:hypothetical protein